MNAEDLEPTDDPLIMHSKRGVAYTERRCEGCGNLAWMRKTQRFCSRTCAPHFLELVGGGDEIGYDGRHMRVHRSRGKATSCYNRELGIRDCISTTYEWSQLHHTDGLDPLDYVPLCKSCHAAYDKTGVPLPSIQGSKNHRAVLTEEIVLDCSRRHASGETYAALGRRYGISDANMRKAVLGLTWKHLHEARRREAALAG